MSSNPKIAVIVLAAGASTRLGTAKQLLPWKGTTLLQHSIETISGLNCDNNFLVLGANHKLIKSKIEFNEVEVLVNDDWELGLGNSISFGVKSVMNKNLEADGILVMLADQPLINSEYLNKIIASFNSSRKQIIASIYNYKKQGVPALFDACYFKELIELNDDEGAKHLIKKHSTHVKTVKHDIENLDIDTFEDYESLYHANHQ